MVGIVTIDTSTENSCEATGHPSECTEPVPGQIQKASESSLTVTNSSGETQQVATVETAVMHFDSHAHSYNSTDDVCEDTATHDVKADSSAFKSITLNGSAIYLVEDDVATDPKSGGPINVI
jgi:hypothetical protein